MIPASWGLLHPSHWVLGPYPHHSPVSSQTGSGPASIPRGTWCTFHKLSWFPLPLETPAGLWKPFVKKKKEKKFLIPFNFLVIPILWSILCWVLGCVDWIGWLMGLETPPPRMRVSNCLQGSGSLVHCLIFF